MKLNHLKSGLSNNKKILENYFFMTFLQIASSFIGIFLYPYLIRVLGAESYGLYVFALSITSFFGVFVKFGFNLPATKYVVDNIADVDKKNQILSAIFTSKTLLFILCTVIISILFVFVPVMRDNQILFILCFSTIIVDIIFPQWYFQAVQKMKFVTIINLSIRILTIPFIFIFIHNPEDNWIYALIVTASMFLGGIASTFILWKNEKVFPKFVPIRHLKKYFQDGLPFFGASSVDTIKSESITLILGNFFGMADVAIYDLANKIVSIPRFLTDNINTVLFPKLASIKNKETVNKVIRTEVLIGLIPVVVLAIFGYWIVLLMGGHEMLLSYPLAVILSLSIPADLVLGSYVGFIFVIQEKFRFIVKNQFATLIFYVLVVSIGLFFFQNIFVLVGALMLTSFFRIIHCKIYINRNNLR